MTVNAPPASKADVVFASEELWREEAERRFGPDEMKWRFVCPVCGHVASVQDWKDAGARSNAVAFSCVGRWAGAKRDAFGNARDGEPGPCNYAGGGFFALNPVTVHTGDTSHRVFAFADPAPHDSTLLLSPQP